MSISRCTQNPTFMEEWRKGWHPEKMNVKGDSNNVLVVGSGPAGLEAAWALCRRGYEVVVSEAKTELGGRVVREAKLPGLSAWGRVVDYRQYQLSQRSDVEIYLDSELNVDSILEFGFENICIATGAKWRADGVSRQHLVPMPIEEGVKIYTPDDLMDGTIPQGNVIVFDDDHYYMGGVLSELLANNGAHVTLITPAAYVSDWTNNTLEQSAIHARLANSGVDIILNRGIIEIYQDHVVSNCVYTGRTKRYECDAIVMVASRLETNTIFTNLKAREEEWADAGIKTVEIIGDANAPGPIAWATYAGHRYARELDADDIYDTLPFRREITALAVD
jgi:dimethylamine/trimethylamine dehydrogenase